MSIHKPVLLREVIDLLNLKSGDVVADATLGGAGHSAIILSKIGESGKLIAIDADSDAIEKFKVQSSKFKAKGRVFLVNDNFANLENILRKLEINPHTNSVGELLKNNKKEKNLSIEKSLPKKGIGVGVNAILADLGWSSDQLEGRGMSFRNDEALDMRLDRNQKISAKTIVNEYSEEELGRIISEYGEEKFWKSIARKIVEHRKIKKIETTLELAEIVKLGIPHRFRYGKISPTTKTFQALRIEVNNELENLKKFIPEAIDALLPGGRLAIISFHSLEDRIVKNIFRENARGCILTDEITGQKIVKVAPGIKIITKKPVVASAKEVLDNPRARSAKLRVAGKI